MASEQALAVARKIAEQAIGYPARGLVRDAAGIIDDALAQARAAGEAAGREQLQHALDAGLALAAERDRLRAGLEMLAQCRHVSGSAQGAFRSNLAIADAVLAGADVRDFATVDAITKGTWRPAPTAGDRAEGGCA